MFRKWFKETQWALVFSAAALIAIGSLFIYSASYHDAGNYLGKQAFWIPGAVLALFLIPFIGYRTFLSVSYLLYAVALGSLVWVLIGGVTRHGAQLWVKLGPLVIQPSEFAKLATVVALANFLGSNHAWEKRYSIMVAALGIAAVPLLLILKQPDLGSAMIFIPMILGMLFLWGMQYRVLIFSILAGVIATPISWELLKPYQQKRILVFLNPNLDPLGAGYTAIQSKIAVGSGGLLGKGYLAGTQSQLQFVPEHHTDFIFCVIGEEWGYAGTLLILCLYGFLFHAAFQVMQKTTDIKAKLLIAGVVSMLFTQVFINVAMTFGLMPITGITLPLVSYGGSSLVASAVGVGLILSVFKERSIF